MSDVTPSAAAPAPSLVDLQAEVTAAREELVASIAELKSQATPKALAERGGRTVTGFFTDEFGGIRPERVAIAGALAYIVGMVVLVTLVALNLFGLFEVTLGGGAMGSASELASKEGASGAFFNASKFLTLGGLMVWRGMAFLSADGRTIYVHVEHRHRLAERRPDPVVIHARGHHEHEHLVLADVQGGHIAQAVHRVKMHAVVQHVAIDVAESRILAAFEDGDDGLFFMDVESDVEFRGRV